MRIDILTLFPDMCNSVLGESIIGRAQKEGILSVYTHNIRDYSTDKHRRVDDTPYGGGKGMLMSAVPVCACFDAVKAMDASQKTKVIYLSPKGKVLTQRKAEELASLDRLILLCGHYEGIDERAIEEIGAEELSVGDYVLTGGELPALIVIDAVSRLVEGVLGNSESADDESFSGCLLEYPQYTRPREWHGSEVPEVLLSGNHARIQAWREEQALRITLEHRPEMIREEELTPRQRKLLRELRNPEEI